MLKNVKLKNFQSHIDTEINLDKGVNCIVGSSDSGKSSIVRALKWLILNRPQGDAFKNNETKPKDTVSIECNGIIRKKNKKENSYVLNNETLKAIKTDVPQEIQNCLLVLYLLFFLQSGLERFLSHRTQLFDFLLMSNLRN